MMAGYTVIDVETTGLSPEKHDRIVEIGVVHVSHQGEIQGRWSTLVNPLRDVGPTHIHGITATDVVNAPPFAEVAPQLMASLVGRIPVAHNASFDMRFLAKELVRAGVPLTELPLVCLCTMRWSNAFLAAPSRRLVDCCRAAGVTLKDAHSAGGDALATAHLLAEYLRLAKFRPPWQDTLDASRAYAWPAGSTTVSPLRLTSRSEARSVRQDAWLDAIVSRMPRAADDRVDSYLGVLELALIDGFLSEHEKVALVDVAEEAGLSRSEVLGLHEIYLRTMAEVALEDAVVTSGERAHLERVAGVLGLDPADVDNAVIAARDRVPSDRRAVSSFSTVGIALRPGDRIVFTGDMEVERRVLEERARTAGLESVDRVTKTTRLVVAADPNSPSVKAAKARSYGIPIITEKAFLRLRHEMSAAPEPVRPPQDDLAPSAHNVRDDPTPEPPQDQGQRLTPNQVSIEIHTLPMVSFAMAHNNIKVVRHVEVTNNGADLRAASFKARVVDSQGTLTHPFEHIIDLPAGEALTFDGIDLQLDPAAMFQVEDLRPGRVQVWVEVGGVTVAEVVEDIQVLAGMHWLFTPPTWQHGSELSLEMLAAHVMPNAPEIADLLKDVSTRLEAASGSPSLEGYQGGPERVDQIVGAVYAALQAREIRYAEPPASWGVRGQKVRTPQEVLGDRIGTCLDLVVVMAACLEQSGIRPLLWVVEGHAFLGYWRVETALDAIAQVDVNDVVNRLDLGQMGLVETTSVTAGPTRTSFESACRSPYETHLAADLGRVLGVVDVWTARHAALFPLPARRRGTDGAIQVVEYRPAAHSAPPSSVLHESPGQASSTAPRLPVPPRVSQWKNALLDLSLRNRLINFSPRQAINLAIPGSALGLVEDLLNARRPLSLMPSDQVEEIMRARGVQFGHQLPSEVREELLGSKSSVFTDVTTAAYATRLRGLTYKARTITQETGSNNLYLALGSLVWTHERRELRSPLILLPVTLLAKSRQTAYRLDLDESGQSTPNYCLLEKLRQVHGMTVPGLANPVEDQSGIDLDAAFTAMREALAERGLPFRVEATADLAILQFAKFRLWKDLDENWDEFSSNSLVRHLTHTPNVSFTDTPATTRETIDLDTLAARCPIPADASQLTAVSDAVAGRTFVLEGPPGTGKSQTITNLLARATAEGRRVLFVAEKRAALDVVKNRLDAVGMGPFSLDLHDKGSKPAAVREQLRLAFDHRVDVDRQGLQARTDEMLSSGRSLTRYAQRLHETNGAGLSLYSATTQLLTLRSDVETLSVPQHLLAPLSSSDINLLRQTLAGLPEVADQARPGPQHPWAFVGINDATPGLLTEIGGAAAAADQALTALSGVPSLSGALGAATHPEDLDSLAGILRVPQVPLDTLDRTRSVEWRSESARTRQEVHTFVSAAHPGLDVATPDALRLPVADLHAQAQAAAASSWFGRKKRLRIVLSQLESGLRPGSVVHPKDVPALTAALVQLQGSVHHLATSAGRVDGVSVPAGWNPLTEGGSDVVASQLDWLQWAGSVVETHSEITHSFGHELRTLVTSGMRVDDRVILSVESLSAALKQVFALTGATPEHLDKWRAQSGLLTRWEQTTALRNARDPQLGSLRRWLDLRLTLLPLKRLGMPEALELVLSGRLPADEAGSAFERGLASVSVAERRSATGLDAFDPTSHERSIGRFRQSSSEVQTLLKVALPDQAMTNRQFASESETGRIGALRRELAKQRRGLGVRSLLEQYGDLITQLTPCVLVSPDSLARFFPARHGLFDVVVFDEASQIRVADAIGAMGRASSVVVVGDSQQMPPTNFAEPSLDFDDDQTEVEMVVADEESILSECVNAAVPRHWLSWHYRSQDESLISFSNLHYYEGRLSSFPAPVSAVSNPGLDGHGISLVRVTGKFHRSGAGKLLRTNPEEAKAVVAEIARRFDAATPGVSPSIGIVTFNQQQRAFIEALIRDSHDERLIDALDNVINEGLFIKNLENVQGDERDVILFSTGFSANDKGVLPLNFGPLNRGGGERRLNVAVTRARRQVIVFSSFDPSQLRADETTSVGIKHLRAYLDVAERGPDALPARAVLARTLDRHREEVADALRQRGYHVTTDVGLSEFRVDISVALSSAPKQPVAAILLDSPTWAARKTVGDRDGLPHDVLGRMLRWPLVARVWLPSWLEDPDTVLDRFEGDLRATVAAGGSAQPTVIVVEAVPMDGEELPIQESAWADPLKAAFASDAEGRPWGGPNPLTSRRTR